MLLHDLIFSAASRDGDATAVVFGDNALSYAELAGEVERVATGLAGLGLRPGQRVGILLNKRFETVVSVLAVSMAGGVFVPINTVLKPPQVGHIVADCDITILVTTTSYAASLASVLPECPSLDSLVLLDPGGDDSTFDGPSIHAWDALTASRYRPDVLHRRIDNDVAAILYTSGSTGRPKGVVLSQRNMVNGAISVSSYLENAPEDRILAVLPFSFDAGFSQMTTAFAVGATVVLMDYLLPRDVIKAAAKHRATGLTGVPPLWNQLAKLEWPQDVVESLRYIANTGGAMPTATLAALRQKLPQTRPYLMYGLTEAFRSTYLPPEELDKRPTSIGKAIPDAEILVVRDDGTECEPGEPGELVHRGALVALGYWNDPERTADRFKPAPNQPSELPFTEYAVWSGDTVVKDDEGFLYFVGRKDDMIKSSGYRISPTEVEEIVYATKLVTECAALGIAHPELGQAVVVAASGNSADDDTREQILKICRTSLPNYMVPATIVWETTLPRNPNGKIDRKLLTRNYADLFTAAADD